MSKKDYIAVAGVLLNTARAFHSKGPEQTAIDAVAHGLAAHFAEDNPRFNRHRFLVACGLGEEAVK